MTRLLTNYRSTYFVRTFGQMVFQAAFFRLYQYSNSLRNKCQMIKVDEFYPDHFLTKIIKKQLIYIWISHKLIAQFRAMQRISNQIAGEISFLFFFSPVGDHRRLKSINTRAQLRLMHQTTRKVTNTYINTEENTNTNNNNENKSQLQQPQYYIIYMLHEATSLETHRPLY